MTLKEQWEEMRKSIHQLKEGEANKEEEERRLLHQRREEAQHRVDKATGSETLDD